ncbi:MAG: hypothetical protein OXH85_06325 [Truepera sp.]|nr:hypothetical protein [Truepera sp.]
MSISAKRLKEIEAIQDKDIDYAEIPEADESFWQRVELQMPQPKVYPFGQRHHRLAEIEGQGLSDPHAMLRELMRSEKEQRGRRRQP